MLNDKMYYIHYSNRKKKEKRNENEKKSQVKSPIPFRLDT